MDGTTVIKIDYYEELKRKADFVDKMVGDDNYKAFNELKAKADKYDVMQIPFKPTTLRSNEFGDILGKCKCGATVLIDENYCNKCSQRLDWTE